MISVRTKLRWHALMVRDLIASRGRYPRTRDWMSLLMVYGAHTMSGFAGVRRLRCRAPLPDDPDSVTLRLGTADIHVLKEVFLTDVYSFATPALTAMKPVRVVVDLGANIGMTVRLWSRLFPGSAVLAVEPDSANLQLCVANAGAAAERLRTVRCFVGAVARTAGIDRALGTWAYRMSDTSTADDGDTIPVRTVPEILQEAHLGDARIDLLKCDIEGAEAEVFRGGPAWLRRVRCVLAEVHGAYTPEAIAADVRAAGGSWDLTVDGPLVLLIQR